MSAVVSNVKMRHKPKADSTKIDYFLEDSFYGRHGTFSANNCCDIHSVLTYSPAILYTCIHARKYSTHTIHKYTYTYYTRGVRYDRATRARVSSDDGYNNTPRTGCNSGIRLKEHLLNFITHVPYARLPIIWDYLLFVNSVLRIRDLTLSELFNNRCLMYNNNNHTIFYQGLV